MKSYISFRTQGSFKMAVRQLVEMYWVVYLKEVVWDHLCFHCFFINDLPSAVNSITTYADDAT